MAICFLAAAALSSFTKTWHFNSKKLNAWFHKSNCDYSLPPVSNSHGGTTFKGVNEMLI